LNLAVTPCLLASMITTPALVTPAAGAPFEVREVEHRDLRDDDVLIDIEFAGICHSDIHQGREEWGTAIFPMVPGHEIAGVVAAVGSAVTRHRVGDRVGVGCMVDSCGECEYCKDGQEQFCGRGAVMTYNGMGYDDRPTMGGYARRIVVQEHFVVKIPAGIDLDEAAPLLCAGITTWSPLRRFGAGPGKKVAVVGLGGLGHMALKLAVAMGAEVTALSRSEAKRADALELGAHDYVATQDADLRSLRSRFDLIVNSVSADLKISSYVAMLKPLGALVNVGLPPSHFQIHPGALVGGTKILAGSNIGGIPETQEMLDFCAEHGIGATIERITADQVDEAWDRAVAGDVRFRFVIDTATIATDAG
jgi:D-arabinose 1-dehydrogenase-like Zn-dependent alcohol dehydrogenase